MPIIRPVSDLRNNFTEIENLSKNQPIFLTKNGVGIMVVLSMSEYERQYALNDLYNKLNEAELEITAGDKGKDYKDVIKELRAQSNG
jgi:prevent-host-death family protein